GDAGDRGSPGLRIRRRLDTFPGPKRAVSWYLLYCMSLQSSRREFIRTFVFGTVLAAGIGQPWRRTYLAEAAPAASDGSGLLQIKLSEYPSLLSESGSVRIGVNGILDDNTGPLGFFYPIIVNRGSGNQFYALDSGCSHAGCVVGIYDEFEGA